MNNKEQKPRRRYNNRFNKDKRTQENKRIDKQQENRIVYSTKEDGPAKKADWQLKLQAISMCMSNHDGKIINSEVEDIYQGLIHRTK